MSDRDVTTLLDRLAASTPAMDVSVPEVVGTGRRRVRRRRATASGMTLGGLALVAAVWVGAGQDSVLCSPSVAPAGVAWEVDHPTSVTISEGPPTTADLLTVEKSDAGTTALLGLGGKDPEVVDGERGPGGIDVFVGSAATLVVWDQPGEVEDVLLLPAPSDLTAGTADGDLGWTLAREPGYRPSDLVLTDGRGVWTATGEQADTAVLEDDGMRLTAFALPTAGLVGYLDPSGSIATVDAVAVTAGEESYAVVRLPREAVFARETVRDPAAGSPAGVSAPRLTRLVGDWSMALFTGPGAPDSASDRIGDVPYEIEWSSDGETWHRQPTDLEPSAPRPVGTRGAGDEVTILGETYRVALDPYGWPRLLDDDGSDFLAVSDEDAPPSDGGGMVMWRAHWWPWADHHEVHFAVDGQPTLDPGQEGQDAVTLVGPAGEVGIVAVPAGS